jgi:hypothetical protein
LNGVLSETITTATKFERLFAEEGAGSRR